MPRLDMPVTTITRAGVAPPAEVVGDPANNHQFANDGETFLIVRNAGATVARVVSVVFSRSVDGFVPAPRTVSVPVGATRYLGTYPPVDYGSTVAVNVDNAELRLTALSTQGA
jgi:hypothetical protein